MASAESTTTRAVRFGVTSQVHRFDPRQGGWRIALGKLAHLMESGE